MRVSSTYTNYFTGYDLVNKNVFSFDLNTVDVSDWRISAGRYNTARRFDLDAWCSETRLGIIVKLRLRCILKTSRVKAEETWVGSSFQTRDAMGEKDF